MAVKIRFQLTTKISIREKDSELGESGDLVLTGRIFGNDSHEVSKHVELIEKLCKQADLEVWFDSSE